MKNYSPQDMDGGTHLIQVTLQTGEYKGHLYTMVMGNCYGRSMLDFDFDCNDLECFHTDVGTRVETEGEWFTFFLQNDKGDTLETEEMMPEEANNLIVGIQIIDYGPNEEIREKFRQYRNI